MAGLTHLEQFVESCGPLPAELQRLLSTLGDLDERIVVLRTKAKGSFERCLDLPAQSTRPGGAAQDAEVAVLRREVEETHKHIQQLSIEKVSGYIRSLDRSLGSFADELVIQAREAEAEALAAQAQRDAAPPLSHQGSGLLYGAPPQPYGGTQPYGYAPQRAAYPPEVGQMAPPPLHHAPSRAPRTHEGGAQPQPRRRVLVAGEQVAANTAESGSSENWIITTFMGISPAGGLYEVQDEEAEPNTSNRYFLESHNVLALPRSASVREERALQPGTAVLGVFPGTTTFYRASVLAAPRRTLSGEYDAYTLQFEDDAEEGGLGRLVDFRFVVAAKGAQRQQ